jgi:hypothetical protein
MSAGLVSQHLKDHQAILPSTQGTHDAFAAIRCRSWHLSFGLDRNKSGSKPGEPKIAGIYQCSPPKWLYLAVVGPTHPFQLLGGSPLYSQRWRSHFALVSTKKIVSEQAEI